MVKFYEVFLDDDLQPSVYVLLPRSVALFFAGELHRTLVTRADLNTLALTGYAKAYK